jgi:hypothetical protein
LPEPYIAEVQVGNWVSDGVREAFQVAGFDIRDWQLTQHLEKQVPADRLFFSPEFSKVFGLQYKALYHNGKDFWPLDQTQHSTLQGHRWIYYCCSELKDVADHRLALHFARFYRSRFEFTESLPATGPFRGGGVYFRWGAFYRGLKACRIGAKVRSQDELRSLFEPYSGRARGREVQQIQELFLVDFSQRVLFAERLF